MENDEKIIKLRNLENDIRRKFGDLYWLFKPRGKVKGFYGTGFCEKYNRNVMFVAERPSKVGFKEEKQFDRPLQLFYETLESFNFENAHITDFIKTKAKAGERNYEDLKDSIEIFDREFEIIEPEIVIGVGNTAFHWLYFYLLMKKKNLKPYKLMHYSQRKPVNSYRESFRECLKKIAEDILKAGEPIRSAN